LTEAAIRLGEDGPRLIPNQPWPDIRSMGNWLRHAYDQIDAETIWNTVTYRLPSLKADLEHLLKS